MIRSYCHRPGSRNPCTASSESLAGGGAARVVESMESRSQKLSSVVESIGYSGQTNADPAFLAARQDFARRQVEPQILRQFVNGEAVRDYAIDSSPYSIFMNDSHSLLDIQDWPGAYKWLWPSRTTNWARATFSEKTYREEGRTWWEWHQIALHRLRNPLSIAYANVSTHNHFCLDRAGLLFNPHSPCCKLPQSASVEDHLALLGLLNSSSACFWLKQNSHNKGNRGGERSTGRYAWESYYEFTGVTLQDYPPPRGPAAQAWPRTG